MHTTPKSAAIHRRSMRLYDALNRRMKSANRLPVGSDARAEAVARFKAWRANVFFPLERRLWPLAVQHGIGRSV